jgi:alkylation response protein AidB-like acyl-CoA dehydrogenase
VAIVVPPDTPGVRVVKRWEMVGLRSSGTYQVSLHKSVRGAALVTNQVFGAKLAHMEMLIEVMKHQCLAAARDYDTVMTLPDAAAEFLRRGSLKSALTNKMFCGQAGWEIAGAGSEMFGGLGYTHESIIGKLTRDMRYVSIVEGSDDMLRDLVYNRYVVPVSKRGLTRRRTWVGTVLTGLGTAHMAGAFGHLLGGIVPLDAATCPCGTHVPADFGTLSIAETASPGPLWAVGPT